MKLLARRVGLASAVAAVSVVALVSVVASPFLLVKFDQISKYNWTRLSEIGQTYGAISAVVSALAFGGVFVSVMIQANQARLAKIAMVREMHNNLLGMLIDKPLLYGSVIDPSFDVDAETAQRSYFALTAMNYYSAGYVSGVVSEDSLRIEVLPRMFKSHFTRRWWEASRPAWETRAKASRREEKFFRIVDSEYRRAALGRRSDEFSSSKDAGLVVEQRGSCPPLIRGPVMTIAGAMALIFTLRWSARFWPQRLPAGSRRAQNRR